MPLKFALGYSDLRGAEAPAEIFSKTAVARYAIDAAERTLDLKLEHSLKESDNGMLKVSQFANAIDVARPTTNLWMDRGDFIITKAEIGRGALYMAPSELVKCAWERPEDYPQRPIYFPLANRQEDQEFYTGES